MKTFHYEYAFGRFFILDRRRGSPDAYSDFHSWAMAVTDDRDAAEMIVAALNAQEAANVG